MPVSIRQIHPMFVGEVTGVDLSKPLSREDAAAIARGMDELAVLVFHDQKLTRRAAGRVQPQFRRDRALARQQPA